MIKKIKKKLYFIYRFWRFGLLKIKIKKLQENKENDVISLLNTGKSVRQVAEILHVSKSVVGRIKKRCCTSLGVSKGGRPKLLSEADERFCVRQAQKTQPRMQVRF